MKRFFTKSWSAIIRPFTGYFSQLLTSLILLFIFRPYGRGALYMAIWEVFLVVLFLTAMLNCHHSKKIKIFAACFGIPALLLEWIHLIYPHTHIALAFVLCTIIFIFITTSSIIKQVVINARVRMETLRGVVCAYFMVAFGFAFFYYLVSLIDINSFSFSNFDPLHSTHSHLLSELMYFSFVTLLCIGYGDVIAVHDVAQTLAILEGVVGQFYIAILVSRLVAVYSFFEHKLHLVSKDKS